MRSLTIASERVYTGEGGPFQGHVRVAGGRIAAVGEGRPEGSRGYVGRPGDQDAVLDVGRARVIPGLIDLHIHGAGGYSVSSDSVSSDSADSGNRASDSAEELENLALYLACNGITAFQPTAGAARVPSLERTIALVRDLSRGSTRGATREGTRRSARGARSLGLHLEGPFLNPARKGAMPEEYLLAPDIDLVRRWLDIGEGAVKHMTVAPELPGSQELISYLATQGVTVSLGHTEATFDQMNQGFAAGATVATHTFNAMTGLHHREPGAAGAALLRDDAYCEVIADGIHVHDAVVRLLLRVKGPDRVCLVSDACPPAGLGPGRYQFLGREVTIDGAGRCVLSDGTLAGSVLLLKDGLRRLVEDVGVPFEVALRMATVNPAKVSRAWERKGSLAQGKDADVVVLDDSYEVLFSMVEGEVQVDSLRG